MFLEAFLFDTDKVSVMFNADSSVSGIGFIIELPLVDRGRLGFFCDLRIKNWEY